MDDIAKIAAGLRRCAYWLSQGEVRECYDSIRRGDTWDIKPSGEGHRLIPYPMSFYPCDYNIYWARGWGCSTRMMPHERWLIRLAVREYIRSKNDV